MPATAAFLRKLRKKHKLGEFKSRGRRKTKTGRKTSQKRRKTIRNPFLRGGGRNPRSASHPGQKIMGGGKKPESMPHTYNPFGYDGHE